MALIERSECWVGLAHDAELIPTAAEEILRWANLVTHIARIATRDTELLSQGRRDYSFRTAAIY